MTSVVLTVIGRDRPGLVDALSRIVAEHGGNWEESRMSHLADQFAGIVRVRIADEAVDALVEALRALDDQGLLQVTAERAAREDEAPSRRLTLEVTGQDHPGIVHDLSHALAGLDVGIEEMRSETRSASMSGERLFHATIALSLPAGVELDALHETLEALANEIMVEVELGPDA